MQPNTRAVRREYFARSDDRVLTGVAAGLGAFLGLRPWVARLGFVLMGLGGFGVLVYAGAYLASSRPRAHAVHYPQTTRHLVGFLLISTGVMTAGLDLSFGAVDAIFSLRAVWLAALATTLLLTLVFGPWLLRLVKQVGDERTDRIRSEERADISAHLHDSVLNTLALIQRLEAKPEVVMMARRQERELRAWMQGRVADETTQLDAAIDALVSRVEEQYEVSIDAVVVGGSVPLDEKLSASVSAIQEAAVNAARHSGVQTVSVYVEVTEEELTAFVRDQGKGFERSGVDGDRRGIADSIEGRIRRVGGRTMIRSAVGEGTEVEMQVPR